MDEAGSGVSGASGTGVEEDPGDEAVREATERWFVRRGLPHFIDHYSATEDIFTRAAPLLAVVFVVELLNGLNVTFPWWGNVLSVIGGLVVGIGGFALVNRLRGRRPFERPDTIGGPELAGFVLIPPIVPLVVGAQPLQALEVLGFNIVFLGLVYVVTSYGLIPLTRWAGAQLGHQFRNVTSLFVQSLPLLLLFTMFLFINAEAWKVVSDLPGAFLATAIAILVAVGSLFIALRSPRELSASGRFEHWSDVEDEVVGTPVAGIGVDGLTDPPHPPPLRRRARFNVGLVLFVSQAIQVLLVTVTVFVFYVVFGLFTVRPETMELWIGESGVDVLWTFPYFGSDVVVTGELLSAALFIAAVAGLQFTVAAQVDSTYREEFYRGIAGEVRQALGVRALYLARLVPGSAPP